MSDQPTSEETSLWQRRLASQANDRAWTLSESLTRTAAEDEEMVQAAHAAMYFWKLVGNAKNQAHAAQLVAHTYALLGLGDPAKKFLAKSTPVFFGTDVEAWELALAHAVSANVAFANTDSHSHRQHYGDAVRLIQTLTSAEDRQLMNATLRVIPVPSAGAD